MLRVLMGLGAAAIALALSSAGANAAWFLMSTTRLDLTAGPAATAALISPDGTRILHLGPARQTCMLSLTDPQLTELACKTDTYETRPRLAEDMFWSPDGTHLLMPTYIQAFVDLQDTDIRIFDAATLEVTNLTNDGMDDGILHPMRDTAYFDHTARWIDEDTIAFIRYVVPKEGFAASGGPLLMTIDIDGEPAPLIKLGAPGGGMIHTLAVSPDGTRFAYTIDEREGVKGAGLYLVDLVDRRPRRVLSAADVGTPPASVTFSADGRYLLLLSQGREGIEARTVDIETAAVVPVGDGKKVLGVAWSPAEAALAYTIDDGDAPDHQSGLYIAQAPGEPGELFVRGRLMPPVCCGRQPFAWTTVNSLLLGRIEDSKTVLFVTLSGP